MQRLCFVFWRNEYRRKRWNELIETRRLFRGKSNRALRCSFLPASLFFFGVLKSGMLWMMMSPWNFWRKWILTFPQPFLYQFLLLLARLPGPAHLDGLMSYTWKSVRNRKKLPFIFFSMYIKNYVLVNITTYTLKNFVNWMMFFLCGTIFICLFVRTLINNYKNG